MTDEDTPPIDELFDGTIDTLGAFTRRKRALADVERYRALYYVYRHRDETVYLSDLSIGHRDELFQSNLLARIPHPRGDEEVRITITGRDEIEADIQHYL